MRDPLDTARRKAAMRARGWRKVALVTIGLNQLFTMVFVCVGQLVDPDLTMIETLVFSCATSALVSYWLLVDARNAWRTALEKGYIGSTRVDAGDDLPKIAECCSKRWLVILHIELHPHLAGTG
ncbi:hypothetical protein [Burkholderia sp. Ac-20353]|uniref:hypothetical protein n=1 Tax=Burkholderia sp. Ac-20353 TaxID=2703894 RepID=UPI001F11C902|nr:hypothetical protein [Burkholderia sp. Ac-20353]